MPTTTGLDLRNQHLPCLLCCWLHSINPSSISANLLPSPSRISYAYPSALPHAKWLKEVHHDQPKRRKRLFSTMPWWFVRCYPYSDTISQVDYVAIVGLVMLAAFSVAPVGSNILVLLGQGLSRGREYSACCGYEDVLFIAEVVQDLLHLFKVAKTPRLFFYSAPSFITSVPS